MRALLLAVPLTPSFEAESRGDPTCWKGGVDFEFCCGDKRGYFGNRDCWKYFPHVSEPEAVEGYSYQRCCASDPEWNQKYRWLRCSVRELLPQTRWLSRFDFAKFANMFEFFILSTFITSEAAGQVQQYLRLKVLPNCTGLHFVSDVLEIVIDVNAYAKNINTLPPIPWTMTIQQSESLNDVAVEDIRNKCFLVFHATDDKYVDTLRRIRNGGGRYISFELVGKASFHNNERSHRFLWSDRHALSAAHATAIYAKQIGASWQEDMRLEGLTQLIDTTRDLEGDFVEIGVFQGISARVVLEYLMRSKRQEAPQRHCHLFDSFEGFSPDDESWYLMSSIERGVTFADTVKESVETVHETLKAFGGKYNLHVQDIVQNTTLPSNIQAIAAANVDVDSFDATLAALLAIANVVVIGGVIRIDDAVNIPSMAGALLAIEEFITIAHRESLRFAKLSTAAEYFLVRTH